MSEYIGIVIDRKTKELRMVVNPSRDEQLEDKSWVTAPEDDRVMIKVSRTESPLFSKDMNPMGVKYIQGNLEKFLERVEWPTQQYS